MRWAASVTFVFANPNVLGLEHMKYCHEIYVQFPHTRTHAPRTQTYTDWLMRDGSAPEPPPGGERAGTRHAHGKASSNVMMQLAYRVPSLLAPSCAAVGLAAALLASFLAALEIFV